MKSARHESQRIFYAPSGLAPYHLHRGEQPQALRLLEDHATDDLGRLRLATYLLLTGQLDQRIAEVRTQPSESPRPRTSGNRTTCRLLTYLLRPRAT